MSKYWLYLIYFSCIKPKFSDDLYSRWNYEDHVNDVDLTTKRNRQDRLISLKAIFKGNDVKVGRCYGHQAPLDATAVFGEKQRGKFEPFCDAP